MSVLEDELQLADIIIKLGAAVNSSKHLNSEPRVADTVHGFQLMYLEVVGRSPEEDDSAGSATLYLEMMKLVHRTMEKVLSNEEAEEWEEEDGDRTEVSFALFDLLRACARGTAEGRMFRRVTAVGCGSDPSSGLGADNKLVSYLRDDDYRKFSEAYTNADVMEVLFMAGKREMVKILESPVDPGASVLKRINIAINSAMLPVMFDGMRLRAGVQMAVRYAYEKVNAGVFFSDFLALRLLTGGDSLLDCARVRRTAALLIALAREGCRESGESTDVIDVLESAVSKKLHECRRASEAGGVLPSRAVRLVIAEIANFGENLVSSAPGEDEALALRLALRVPCLHPHRELIMADDVKSKHLDSKAVSVWDAIRILSTTRRYMDMPCCPLHLLMASVMGGTIMSLIVRQEDVQECGPFRAIPRIRLAVAEIEKNWPSISYELPTVDVDTHAARRSINDLSEAGRENRGKLVSPNASICAAIETGVYKRSKEKGEACDARYSCAISMMSTAEAFYKELSCSATGDFECRPTDGLAPLKRVYVSELSTSPCVVDFLRKNPAAGNPLYEANSKGRSATAVVEDGDALESPWREIVGGSVLFHGWNTITAAAFKKTLEQDWAPMPSVQHVLVARRSADNPNQLRVGGVMTPGVAMRLLSKRAIEVAKEAFDEQLVNDYREGSEAKRRVMRQQLGMTKAAYYYARYAPLWECMIQNLISSKLSRKSQTQSSSSSKPRPYKKRKT